jgi:hypothetical protein
MAVLQTTIQLPVVVALVVLEDRHLPFVEVTAVQAWHLVSAEKVNGMRVVVVVIFNTVGDEVELAALAEKGFTHLWLMGVWPTGPKSRAQALEHADLRREYGNALPGWTEADVLGSPYAVAALEVSPLLGGDAALVRLRKRLAAFGIRLVLDFVPNHLGLDHAWVRTHPEYFVGQTHPFPDSFPVETAAGRRFLAHGKDPYFPGWTDTVQLDYRRPETREAMAGSRW